jgi:cell wall-associated NlpC family hydrolase
LGLSHNKVAGQTSTPEPDRSRFEGVAEGFFMTTTVSRSYRHALTLIVAGLLAGLVMVVSPTATGSADALSIHKGHRVVHIAASRRGAKYKWGAEGPRRFDCSGLTFWTFRHVGKRIPRVAADQYRATRHVRRHHRRKGDLVFFHHRVRHHHRARSVYHVGIYAGRGMMWDAPHTGARVRKEHIWSRRIWYGRVR